MKKLNIMYKWVKYWFTRPKYQFDRVISGSWRSQMASLSLLFVIVFGIWFGLSVLFRYDGKTPLINHEIDSTGWSILSQMIDPGNQHMVGAPKEIGQNTKNVPITCWRLRLFVFLISLSGTIVFSGLLISTITNIFNRRIEKINAGLINYKFRNHFVVIGFDFMAIGLIKKLLQKEKDCKIVLHTILPVRDIKSKLISQIAKEEEERIIFLHGARDMKDEITRLQVDKSKEIFILGESGEYDHDSRNIVCAKLINEYLGEKSDKVKNCHLLIEHPTTYTAFQFLNINDQSLHNINLVSVNYYEQWAQKVLLAKTYRTLGLAEKDIDYLPLDYPEKVIAEDDDRFIHLVVVGMTRMGIAMAVEAARLGHFANHQTKKTKITFVDAAADEKEHHFANCYSSFYEAIDVSRENIATKKKEMKLGALPFINIKMEFITGKIESPGVRKKLVEWANDHSQILTIAICFNDPPFSLSQGMYLPREVYGNEIPVLIRQESSYAMVNLLCEDKKVENKYKNIKPFGMIDDCLDLMEDVIPKYINHYYWNCDHKEIYFPFDQIEENWKSLQERDKWSNRFNSYAFDTKLRAVQWNRTSEFSGDEIEVLARMEHARWNVERLIAGLTMASASEIRESKKSADLVWEMYLQAECNHNNPEYLEKKVTHDRCVKKLKSKMIHPCIVSYNELSEFYKNIDRKLVGSIPEILRKTNEEKSKCRP